MTTSTKSFRAIVVDRSPDRQKDAGSEGGVAELRTVSDDLLMPASTPGSVAIDVEYSSLNYKDALALTGRPGIVSSFPLIAGIDLVGRVYSSDTHHWSAGDLVILNGAGLGERSHGGFAEHARVDGKSLVQLPSGLTSRQAAAIGTAGLTAQLSVLALERNGVIPASGPVVVTGASGGVGSIAVALLAHRGYRVIASTGRVATETDFLRGLGADEVIDREELGAPGKPLQSARWAAGVDTVGSHTLANVLAQTRYGGVVTCCGLAQGADLPASVLPFILRAVSLVGVNSVDAPLKLRENAWHRLASDLDHDALDSVTSEIGLGETLEAATQLLAGTLHGRTVVDVNG